MGSRESYAAGLLGHDQPSELRRLQLREQVMDPITRIIVADRGLSSSWRCLELGAGTGSVARWLAERCRQGRVVATDLDVRHLEPLRELNVDVLRHDVVGDDFPAQSFDLIHARSLLANVPERDTVLQKIVRWLAEGGWAVIEEPALLLHDSGLREVGMQPTLQLVGDGGIAEQVWRTALGQAHERMVALELIREEDFAAGVALLNDPAFVDVAMVLVSAWGRRPVS